MSVSVLALSSSRVGNSAYLESAVPMIKDFLGDHNHNVAFIPFASVDSYDDYFDKVKEGLKSLPYNILLAEPLNAKSVIENCDVIMVGGGNTFKLLHDLYENDLINLIKQKVHSGTPYIGWSAGANITGKTIGTTNDMPIIEPESFKSFNFFPFQINPHYLNVKPDGHNGETRDQRLEEFVKVNPGLSIVGIPEGTALSLSNNGISFIGNSNAVVFSNKQGIKVERHEITSGEDLLFLLKT